MTEPISILAVGVSCPGGTGPEALEADWPSRRVSENTKPDITREVATIDLAAEPFNRWRMRPRLRRASPLSHHLIEAVAQILESRPDINPARVGLVGSFFIGCLVYSVRFYKGLTTDGRRFASPILFPETVVNTPLSHVVSELKIGGPVYSQTGDTSCWTTALRTAALWLANCDVEHVIVVGGEEFDPVFLDVMQSARWFRGRPETAVAEGAGAVLLGKKSSEALAHIHRIADGFSFRNRKQAAVAAERLLAEFDPALPVADTARNWMRAVVEKVLAGQKFEPLEGSAGISPAGESRSMSGGTPDLLKSVRQSAIPAWGSAHSNAWGNSRFEAFTATCAWNTIRATRSSESRLVVPFWGLSQQMGAIEISR